MLHLLMRKAVLDRTDREREVSAEGHAHGHLGGPLDRVSIGTTRRALCSSVIGPILFNKSGHALDVGPDLRLDNRKRSSALAIRDGGRM